MESELLHDTLITGTNRTYRNGRAVKLNMKVHSCLSSRDKPLWRTLKPSLVPSSHPSSIPVWKLPALSDSLRVHIHEFRYTEFS